MRGWTAGRRGRPRRRGKALDYIPWPSVLPGRTVGPAGSAVGLNGCPRLRIWCVTRLIAQLRDEYEANDAACDHRVIFSLGYLDITREIRRRLRAHETFIHPRWFIGVVQGFSNPYFQTQRRYDRGAEVPDRGGSTTTRSTPATTTRARICCSPATPTPTTTCPMPTPPPAC